VVACNMKGRSGLAYSISTTMLILTSVRIEIVFNGERCADIY
jgi:hypothetical protein